MGISAMKIFRLLFLVCSVASAQNYPYFPPPGATWNNTNAALSLNGSAPNLNLNGNLPTITVANPSTSVTTANSTLNINGLIKSATGARAGDIDITAGHSGDAGGGSSQGGFLVINGGQPVASSTSGDGGGITLNAGNGSPGAGGGTSHGITLNCGNGTGTRNGTGCFFNGGSASGSGSGGFIGFEPGSSASGQAGGVEFNNAAGGSQSLNGYVVYEDVATTYAPWFIDSFENFVFSPPSTSTSNTNGFLYIGQTAGVPTGTPANPSTIGAVSYANSTPITYDATDNRLYAYNSGWKSIGSSEYFGTTGSIGGSLLAAGACSSGTVSITGAASGMAAVATPGTYPGDGNYWLAYVSAANTVTVKICAAVAGTPGASTYNVRVLQ